MIWWRSAGNPMKFWGARKIYEREFEVKDFQMKQKKPQHP